MDIIILSRIINLSWLNVKIKLNFNLKIKITRNLLSKLRVHFLSSVKLKKCISTTQKLLPNWLG